MVLRICYSRPVNILLIFSLLALALLVGLVVSRKLPTPKLTSFRLWGLVALAALVLAIASGKLHLLLGTVPAAAVWVSRIISGIRFARMIKRGAKRGFRPKARLSRKEALEILGLSKNATTSEIEAAYRHYAKTLHPDVGGNEWQIRNLRQAYETLKGSEGK